MRREWIIGGMILLLLLSAPVTVVGAQESGSVTRGKTFTVTVVGDLRAPYIVWVAGTHGMSGEAGDRPPVIAPGQTDVTTDPPGGPYPLGSTPIGGGRTVMDDVAPSSPGVPATSYYAQVRTGIDGRGVVLFLTSQATATQQFHVSAVNPADPDREVRVILGVPAPVTVPTVQVSPLPATSQTVRMPPGHIVVIPPTVPGEPLPTTAPEPPATFPETAPVLPHTQRTPVAAIPAVIGLGVVFTATAAFHGRRR